MADLDNQPRQGQPVDDETLILQVQQFLDDWHYRLMGSSLGKQWQRKKVLKVALEVLSMNGCAINADALMEMEQETQVLEAIVASMNPTARENFEHLSLQLQTVVTMMARIRKSTEIGDHAAVQEVIEESDNAGVGQQVLKQAVVAASGQVAEIHRCRSSWMASMEKRLARMMRNCEEADHAHQQLLAVEAQLERFGNEQNDKNKKVLMGLAEGNDKSLLHSVFSNWLGVVLKQRSEKGIRDKFQKMIDDANAELMTFREKQLRNVRGAMMRTAHEGDLGLVGFTFAAWKKDIETSKAEGDTKGAIEALEAKLKQATGDQAANSKRFLARMNAGKDESLLSMCLQGWVQFSEAYKKDKEFEDQVKKAEANLKAHMEKKKEEAKQVLDRMSMGSDTGLMATCMQAWVQCYEESKAVDGMDKQMQGAEGRFKSLQQRQLGNARGAQTRVNEQMKQNLMARVFQAWQLESKVNHIDKYYNAKIDAKRRQLQSVQTLFKSFAKQLEEGLANVDGDESGRSSLRRKSQGGGMNNSVSLPDIHQGKHQ